MSERLSLSISPSQNLLDIINEAVDGLESREGWTLDFTFKVRLALEELSLNVRQYGGDVEGRDIEITFASDDDRLTIEIVDYGKPFNPLEDAPIPDVDADVGDRPVGGLGVLLVRSMMDDMRYRRDSERNCLTMVANRG